MFAPIRARLSNLSRDTKTLILKGTILTLMILGICTVYLLTPGFQEFPPAIYDEYLKQYDQKYVAEQQQYRQYVFYETYDNMIFTDKKLDSNYFRGINQFSNLNEKEFQELYLMVTSLAKSKGYLEIAEFENNYYYDWSYLMPPPKNMRDYDGSHIFAVTALAEFAANKQAVLNYRQDNLTLDLSEGTWITLAEQEVIDCCQTCIEKKLARTVYLHLSSYGVSTDTNYKYVSSIYNSEPGQCKTESATKPYKIKDFYQISTCHELAKRLEQGPAVVFVDARTWRNYEGGIHDGCSGSPKRNHHAVVVGRGIGYWKIRNSWGPRWGEHGFIRIKSGNTCGICSKASYLELK